MNEPSDVAPPLRIRTARAALTSGGSETVGRILAIVLAIATARVLLPEQVGVLGIASIMVGLVSMIASYAETAAVVSPGAHDAEYSMTGFCARAVVTVVSTVVLLAALPAIAHYLAGPGSAGSDLERLVRLFALQPLIELLGAYPRILLQRRLELVVVAIAGLLQVIVHVGLAIALLWSGAGAVAVVWGSLAGALVAALVPWPRALADRRPLWVWPSRAVTRVFSADFARVFANGFFTYLNAQVDKVMVAATLGPAAMSYYGMATNASRFPGGVLAQTLRYSLMPAVARLQGDKAVVERALLESLRHSFFFAAPIAAGLLVSAPSLVLVVLGERWLPVVPVLRVMALGILGAPFLEGAATLLIGMGRAHLTALGSTLAVVTLVALTPPLALRWGVEGAAWANLASVIVLNVSLVVTARSVFSGIRWIRTPIVTAPLGAAVVAGIASAFLGAQLHPGLYRLLVESLVLIVIYPLAVFLGGGRSTIEELRSLLRRSLANDKALSAAA